MGHSEKSAVVLTGLVFAAIYTILLVGMARTSYFVRGPLFDGRPASPEIVAVNAARQTCEGIRPLCAGPYADNPAQPECARSAQAMQRMLSLEVD
jgi:hypothetical protein